MVHNFGQVHHYYEHNCLETNAASSVTIFKLRLRRSMCVVKYEFGEAQGRQYLHLLPLLFSEFFLTVRCYII